MAFKLDPRPEIKTATLLNQMNLAFSGCDMAYFDPFFFFLEMCDVPLSVSVIEHNTITDAMVNEAKRAGRAYLGTYLPPVLQKRIV